ncbi:MAG: M36 family metallopeptidase, partial [Saprospiraceae bacterium]
MDKIMDFLGEKRTNLGLEARDANDFIVLDNFITSHNQINHIYLQQTIGGIPIENAILNFNIASNGTILNYYNRTSPDASGRVVGDVSLSSENAILNVLSSSERTSCSQSEFLTYDPIIQIPNNTETELIYKDKGQEGIIPVWRVVLNDNEYKIRVDVCATTGRILERKNLVLAFSDNEKKKNSSKKTRNNFDVKKMMLSGIPKYLVFPQSVENPNQGARTEVENPSFSLASPLGWHNDGNVEFTSTQGNNILVKENITGDNSGGTSEGTSDLDFSFSLDLNESPTENIIVQNVDAAITNAFYWANLMHDIWYMYGFDEASGNFQENNFDKGGIGLDAVEIKILDGSGMGNSYFSTTEEGRNPEMVLQIYEDENGDLYNSAFDNGIIAHEYAHGITTRLTGGASTVTCLENEEQMGEGWSDYFALVMTQKKTDINTTSRSLGSYVLGQGVDDLGFRPYPYSTSKAVNPVTYSDVSNTEDFTVPHGVGFIFATMIWDLYWDF